MQKIRLLLSYDGSCFKGWQKQKNTAPTVQASLEEALAQMFGRKIPVLGAGRTDSGVHALGQTAHFFIPQKIKYKIHSSALLLRGLNSLTPPSLSCARAWLAPDEFHAQRSALSRSYRYIIFNTKAPPALRRHFGLWHPRPMSLERLQEMARILIGKKDFKSFQNQGTPVKSTTRTIQRALWTRPKPSIFMFEIEGNSFLKQMVRNVIGAQLEFSKNPEAPEKLKAVLEGKDRRQAFPTAPAHGLFLYKVSYPKALDKKCQKF